MQLVENNLLLFDEEEIKNNPSKNKMISIQGKVFHFKNGLMATPGKKQIFTSLTEGAVCVLPAVSSVATVRLN